MHRWILAILLMGFAIHLFSEGSVVVLCYHTFLGKKFDTDFKAEDFRNQLSEIKALGYQFVTFTQVTNGAVEGNSNILLTIDDGNRSVKPVYEEILRPEGIKPVLFIYPAITDRMFYALKFSDLENMAIDGVTIGGHGYYHLYVNKKLYDKDEKAFHKEIFKSKERLEKHLELSITVFAYPFGSFSDITVEYLKKAGYQYSFSLRHGLMQIPLSRNQNIYDLPRFMVTKSSWKEVYRFLKGNVNGISHVNKGKKYENT